MHLNLYVISRPACPTSSVVWFFLESSQIPLQPLSLDLAVIIYEVFTVSTFHVPKVSLEDDQCSMVQCWEGQYVQERVDLDCS